MTLFAWSNPTILIEWIIFENYQLAFTYQRGANDSFSRLSVDSRKNISNAYACMLLQYFFENNMCILIERIYICKYTPFHLYAKEQNLIFILIYRNAVLQIYLPDERNSHRVSNVMSVLFKFLKERKMLLQPWHVQFMYDIIPRNTQHTAFSHLKTHENLANNVYVHFPFTACFPLNVSSWIMLWFTSNMPHCILNNVEISVSKILNHLLYHH